MFEKFLEKAETKRAERGVKFVLKQDDVDLMKRSCDIIKLQSLVNSTSFHSYRIAERKKLVERYNLIEEAANDS